MPLITDVRPVGTSAAQTRSDRLHGAGEWRLVVLDNGRRLYVDLEQLARHRLEPGAPVGPRVVASLFARDAYLRARERALRLLAVRPRSAWELRQRLARARVPETTIRTVVAALEADGLLDDLSFARSWVARCITGRAIGPRRIRWELSRKGVPAALIDRAISESAAGPGEAAPREEQSALALVRGRLRGYRHLAPDRRARRVAALLERRGFSEETIVRVLRWLAGAERPTDLW